MAPKWSRSPRMPAARLADGGHLRLSTHPADEGISGLTVPCEPAPTGTHAEPGRRPASGC